MVEDLLTHLMVHYMTDHLNWKLYVGQDMLGLLSKKQSTWRQGVIHDVISNVMSSFIFTQKYKIEIIFNFLLIFHFSVFMHL